MSTLPSGAIATHLIAANDLLRLDLQYRIRRLRFVARRLADFEAAGMPDDYEAVRRAVFASLARYLERESPRFLGVVAARWDLAALDSEVDCALASTIADLARAQRRAPLLAYLGFPFYDLATLALLQGEGFDEFDPVNVDRIAPQDATSLSEGEPVLKGTQFNSFGAFFSRAYRENDYLWGRLHGAERLIDILASTLTADALTPDAQHGDRLAAAKHAAFAAILDAERSRLTAIPELFATLDARLATMSKRTAGQAGARGID